MAKATKQKKSGFKYWPQTILVGLGLSSVFFAMFLLFKGQSPAEPDLPPEARLPMTTLLSFQSKDVPVSELISSDKTLVIFWATWCGPCVEEMKRMPKLMPKIKEKGYTTLFINYDSAENKLIADNFSKLNGVTSAYDFRGVILFELGLASLPVSIVVDKTGKVIKTLRGELQESRL